MDDIASRIREFVAQEVLLLEDSSSLTNKTRLVGGQMDSLGLMQLVYYIQQEFNVTVDDSEIVPDNFRTLPDVERFVRHKVETAKAS